MTRFINHINESFEDKIFGILDTFMQERGLFGGKELLSSDIWQEVISYFTDTYNIRIRSTRSPTAAVQGTSGIEGITIKIPDAPMTPKLKVSILGALFHELNHTMQDRRKPSLSIDYMSTDGHGLTDFSMYFLQKIERESQSITITMVSIMSGYNILDMIDYIKTNSSKAKNIDEANKTFRSQLDSMELEPHEFEALKTLFMVCGFIHSLHLQKSESEEKELFEKVKRELTNKWNVFEKKFRKTYKKLHAYFLKYGII